jgi:hypothetical protein
MRLIYFLQSRQEFMYEKLHELDHKLALIEQSPKNGWLEYLPLFISIFVPIVVAVIAGFIAIRQVKLNNEANLNQISINNRNELDLTRANMIAAQRIEWMQNFRSITAKFVSKLSYLSIQIEDEIERTDESIEEEPELSSEITHLFLELELLMNQIKLMLNVSEDLHLNLDKELQRLVNLVLHEESDPTRIKKLNKALVKSERLVISLVRDILK